MEYPHLRFSTLTTGDYNLQLRHWDWENLHITWWIVGHITEYFEQNRCSPTHSETTHTHTHTHTHARTHAQHFRANNTNSSAKPWKDTAEGGRRGLGLDTCAISSGWGPLRKQPIGAMRWSLLFLPSCPFPVFRSLSFYARNCTLLSIDVINVCSVYQKFLINAFVMFVNVYKYVYSPKRQKTISR